MIVITGDKGKEELLRFLTSKIKAIGVTEISRQTNIPRGHIYTLISENGNPTLDSLLKLSSALNFSIAIG